MKTATILLGLLAGLIVTGRCTAQTPEISKKEVSKEISITHENGVKTVTVTTTENGKTSTETYSGKEAEDKIKELEAGQDVAVRVETDGKPADVSRTVIMEENNGDKVLTVTTVENGKTSTETYKGADADAKLKELENNPPPAQKGKSVQQTMQVRKIETKEK